MKKHFSEYEMWEPGIGIVVISAFVSVLWVYLLLGMVSDAIVEFFDRRIK